MRSAVLNYRPAARPALTPFGVNAVSFTVQTGTASRIELDV